MISVRNVLCSQSLYATRMVPRPLISTPAYAIQTFIKAKRLFSTSNNSSLNAHAKEGGIKVLTPSDYALFFNGDKILTCKKNSFVIPFWDIYTDKNKMPNYKDYFFIGEDNGKKIYGASHEEEVNKDGLTFIPARDALAMTNQKTSQPICRAKHLLNWHRTSLYSGCCGSPTDISPVEIAKVCRDCKRVIYPTTSSFVIVLIEREGKILLARSPHFAKGMYSTLAGFVDAGESYEQAVRREVLEEVGIKIEDITYFGSQAWPFPASIAVAYRAKHAEGEIRMDPKEIEDAQWFDPRKLPSLPHPCSLSRHMIDAYTR